MAEHWIGQPHKRIEDPKLLRGEGRYLADLQPEGTLFLGFVRSLQAAGNIRRIDKEEASKLPGVVGLYTHEDLPELPEVPAEGPREARVVRHPVLAKGRVCYVGQPIVAVLARSPMALEDALSQVWVEIDPAPAVSDPQKALEDQVLVHPDLGSNLAYRRQLKAGEVDSAFQQAYRVVRAHLVEQRVAPSPLEGRGTLAVWEGEELVVWSSTQGAHDLREGLAEALGLPASRLRVIAPDVGGAFGAKLNVYPEDVLVAYLAKTLKVPVKWVESRRESFTSMVHGRAQHADLELALDQEGHFLGLRGRVVADMGAFALTTTLGVPGGTLTMLQGPYRIPALDLELLEVYTHATPTGAYRGAGRPEATYYLERLANLAARELQLDPAEIRRRNLIQGPFPYTTLTGHRYDSGAYIEALDRLLEASDYAGLRALQREARAQGRLLGLGLSTYAEITGYGWETGGVRVHPDGSATVFTGTSPHGQGDATAFAQIVAETLGIPLERIQVVHGDTRAIPFGMGTSGSRTLLAGGSAILQAAQRVEEKMRRIAAHLLEASPEDLERSDEGFRVRGAPEKGVSIERIAATAYNPRRLPPDLEPGLEAQATFTVKEATYPFGAHLALVEVDPQTGHVKVLEYWAVDDCGRIVNPLLVEGQLHGGIAQALGQALLEGVNYDAEGQLLNPSFLEYPLPRAEDLPPLHSLRMETPSPNNPLGAKGVGEAGTIGGTPAFVNAVLDALGVAHLDMPLTPEKVWRALRLAGTLGPDSLKRAGVAER
jgi:carbon-monoxide dehydrogenase large subunit